MSARDVAGIRLFHEEHGSGAPILCIHGTGSSAVVWGDAIERLARRGRVIAYDRRGCSRSERPDPYERTSVSEHADDAAALLDALGATPALVVGRSYGGEVALELALRHPDRVRALVLLEGAPLALVPAGAAWERALAERLDEVATHAGVDAVAEALIGEALGDGAWASLPEAIRRLLTANGQAILAEVRGGGLHADPAALAGGVGFSVGMSTDASDARARIGRGWLFAGLGIALALGIVAQIVNANALSDIGDATKYGSVAVPGSAVLRFPAGSMEVLVSRFGGSGSPDAPPGLELHVRPVGGDGPAATLTRDRGTQFGSGGSNGQNGSSGISYRRIFRLDVPHTGSYDVTATGARPNDGYRLGFGNGPPYSAWTIWKLTGIAMLVVLALWFAARALGRRAAAAG